MDETESVATEAEEVAAPPQTSADEEVQPPSGEEVSAKPAEEQSVPAETTEGVVTEEGTTDAVPESATEATGPAQPQPEPDQKEPAAKSSILAVRSSMIDKKVSIMEVGKESSSTRILQQVGSEGYSKSKVQALGSIISFKKGSMLEMIEKGKIPRYMNTYKLWSDNPFNHEAVCKILKALVDETIEKLIYDHDKIPKLVKWASGALRTRVKELQFDRYKLVTVVTIGEKRSQDMLTYVRFLWDLERDRFSYYAAENPGVFMLAMCFGLYYE